MKKKHLKRSALVLSLAVTCALFAGCGGNGAASGNSTNSESGSSATELTFFGFKTANQAIVLEELVEEFNEQNPDIHVTYEGVTMPGGYTDALTTRLASGEGDDVFLVNVNDIVKISNAGYCEDLSSLPCVPKLISSMEINGEIPAIALSRPVIGIYANMDVLKNAGVTELPSTYDEFMAACDNVKAAGYMPIVGGSKEGTCTSSFTTTMGMYDTYFGGGDVLTAIKDIDSGKTSLGDTVRPGLEWTKEIMDKGYINAEASIVQSQLVDALPEFAKGETAFYVMGSWAINDIRESCADMDLSFFGFPVNDKDQILLDSLDVRIAVNKDGKHKEEAMKFVEFMTQTENVDRFCSGDNSFSNLTDGNPALNPVFDTAIELVKSGKTIPWTDTNYNTINFWNIMQAETPKIFAGESVDSVVDSINASVEQVLALQ